MTKTSVTISVVIPTYNEEQVIEQCIRSILRQKISNEIIVVDNFSTDKTVEIAKKFTPLIFKKGSERSSQRNFGASKASGDYLLFLDADMILTNNIIAEALNKAQKGKYIVAFPEKSIGGNFWEKCIAFERNLYHRELLVASARLYPRKLFHKLGGYDTKLIAGEDWDLSIRAQKAGYQLIFTNNSIKHLERYNNLQTLLNKKRYYIKNVGLYAQKHPQIFAKQSSLKQRLPIYFKNLPKFIKDPLHGIGFLFLKTVIWYDWRRYGK